MGSGDLDFFTDAGDLKIVTTQPLKADRAIEITSRTSQPRKSLRVTFLRVIEITRIWRDRAATRRELAQYDDRALKDIGLSRAEAYRETSKRFWRE